jgi:hypothetical protein
MSDLLMLMLLAGAFIGMIGYVRACDGLVRPTYTPAHAPT